MLVYYAMGIANFGILKQTTQYIFTFYVIIHEPIQIIVSQTFFSE